jgi:hypothetical protein
MLPASRCGTGGRCCDLALPGCCWPGPDRAGGVFGRDIRPGGGCGCIVVFAVTNPIQPSVTGKVPKRNDIRESSVFNHKLRRSSVKSSEMAAATSNTNSVVEGKFSMYG